MALAATPSDLFAGEARAEKAKLQKHFGRADIFFFLVCTLVGVDGLGLLATFGGAGFTWLIACVVLFAIPSAMLLAELGATFTDEGGPYVWVRQAFGHLAGAVNNFFYWVTNPVWMGGTLVGTAAGGFITFFNNGRDYSTTTLALDRHPVHLARRAVRDPLVPRGQVGRHDRRVRPVPAARASSASSSSPTA